MSPREVLLSAGYRERSMFGRVTALTIAACSFAGPVIAQAPAPTTTAFDGTYAGGSMESSVYGSDTARGCRVYGAPDTLTITNGVAWSLGAGHWEGSVSEQGRLVMRRLNAARLDGQIDSQGTVRGQISSYNCVNTLIWQKLPEPTPPFDGTYAGLSRKSQATAGPTGGCVPDGPPSPLTIVNGIARTLWGRPAEAEGSVGRHGVLIMLAPQCGSSSSGSRGCGYRFDGQIDGKGTITGRFTRAGACSYEMVYQRKGN
jgi:hypothetical protein